MHVIDVQVPISQRKDVPSYLLVLVQDELDGVGSLVDGCMKPLLAPNNECTMCGSWVDRRDLPPKKKTLVRRMRQGYNGSSITKALSQVLLEPV